MNKRTEIYGTHLNHHVKKFVAYANGDGYVYFDKECTMKIPTKDLTEMFFAGLVIHDIQGDDAFRCEITTRIFTSGDGVCVNDYSGSAHASAEADVMMEN